MTTRLLRALASALGLLVLASCGGASPRFGLRAPLLREQDRLLAHAPEERAPGDFTWAGEQLFFRPLSHMWLLERAHEANNVNALDEVPDSSWYTNRVVTPAESARGPCTGAPPTPPFTVTSGKFTGTTPGLFVRDAGGRRYVLKFDQYPREQPELSTAADAIVTRLYWSLGFNSPCNVAMDVAASDLVVAPNAHAVGPRGVRIPMGARELRQALRAGVHRADGRTRVSLSEFVEGRPLGPFPTEGTRFDDPNDVVPHEHRRELRGERMLAAWVAHWDAREGNALDTYIARPGGGGYVRHWFIDFGDCLGVRTHDDERVWRLNHSYWLYPGVMLADAFTFGLIVRPWDRGRPDPVAPMLSYFDVERFDPPAWLPQHPMARYLAAQPQDLAWMARKIARITPEHVRATVASGNITQPVVARRLTELLLARRERILRWSFARISPLTDLSVRGGDRLCATDLAVEAGLVHSGTPRYAGEFRPGADERRAPERLLPEPWEEPAQLCFPLRPFAPAHARPDAAARYATVDLWRAEGRHRTRLRAHLYDLGPARGFVLVGIER